MVTRAAPLFLGVLLCHLGACGGGIGPTDSRAVGAGGEGGMPAEAGGEGGSGGASPAGGGSSGGTPAPAPPLTCPGGAIPFHGVPFDKARGCVDTEATGEGVACTDENVIEAGYFCVRRLSDGQEFSTFSGLRKPVLDLRYWEPCPSDGLAPTPCFGVLCQERAAPSTCTLAQTTAQLGCGDGDHEWDKSCCLRRACASDASCEAGQSCKQVASLLSWECAPGASGTCSCGGIAAGGPRLMMCVDDGE